MRPEWDGLVDEFSSATTFCTWEWLAPWWRAFGGADQLRVLELRDPSTRSLVALAPLALTSQRCAGFDLRVLRLMGDGSGDSDNLDLPVRSGDETGVALSLLNWLQDSARDWDLCRLNTLPSGSPIANRLLEEIKPRRWTCFTTTPPRSVVDLPETWESYLKMLSSKERGKIGYLTRRLEKKYHLRVFPCTGADQLDACLEALFELHGKHWQARGLPGTLQLGARRQFYREIGTLLMERGRLQFWLLELDGKTVAAQFGFRHGDTVYSLQEGFDPDYSLDSAGYVLRSQAIKQLISEGVRRYDFLGGTDASKSRWGAQLKSYLNIEFARPYTRGSAYLILAHGATDAKRWLRARLSPRTWRALKVAAGAQTRQ